MTLSVRAFGGCVMLSGAFHWNFLGPLVFLNRRAIANQDMCALNNYFYLSEPHFYPESESDLFKTDNAFIHRASRVTDGADGLMSNYEATAVSTAQHED